MGMIELHAPFIITARLMAGVKVGDDCYISIASPSRGADGRTHYVVYIDTPKWVHTDHTLRSGCFGGDHIEGMESFLSFLLACVESGEDGDNSDLFPAHVREWADENEHLLQELQMDLEAANG